MNVRLRAALGILLTVGGALLCGHFLGGHVVALLQPRGAVAAHEHQVMLVSLLVMLSLAVPLLITLFAVAWHFRAENNARYEPDRHGSPAGQMALWVLPAMIVGILWVVTWRSAHELDPALAVIPEGSPVTIQVIALPWKWLFIYPEEGIATVNTVTFPAHAPVRFDLTADAPMSSFWIPQLGSQMYAMAAMKTQLNLEAEPGEYAGRNTEINGDGFAGMTFTAKAVPRAEFDRWVAEVRRGPLTLDEDAFAALSAPSSDVPPAFYASVPLDLFTHVMAKYMPEMGGAHGMDGR